MDYNFVGQGTSIDEAVDAFVGSVIAQHLNDVEHHRTPFSGRRKNRPELQAMFERAHIRHDAKVDTREYGAAAPQVEPELVYACEVVLKLVNESTVGQLHGHRAGSQFARVNGLVN